MLLVIDVGNTNMTGGVFKDDQIIATFRITTKIPRTSDEYGMMLYKKLIYTGVTRAKKMVVLVGSKESVARMVSNENEAKRYTGLTEKLLKLQNGENNEEKVEF